MKYLLILLITLSISASEKITVSFCTEVYDLSAMIMKMRQENTPIKDLIDVFYGNKTGINIVVQAYKQPRYSTEGHQKNAIKDFANLQMTQCLSSINK